MNIIKKIFFKIIDNEATYLVIMLIVAITAFFLGYQIGKEAGLSRAIELLIK